MLLVLVAVVGCQKIDTADKSAAKVSSTETAAAKPGAMPQVTAPEVATQPTGRDTTMTATAAKAGTCAGTDCSPEACAGEEAENGGKVQWATLPEGTKWTPLHVTGMKCSHCADKIEHALAKVDGVKGVRIDLDTAKVSIAVADGKDARTIAKPVIDSLGYHVD
ncbi:MAG: heavy-metal-associated domain-containing protein [Kofleriaceae bacterium]